MNVQLNDHHTFAQMNAAADPTDLVPTDRQQAAPGFTESIAAATQAGSAEETDQAAAREQDAQQAELRHAAEQLVASAFIKPMLSQMRQSPLRTEMFHGGTAEDMFADRLDTRMADEMARGMNFPLVDAVERYMSGRAAEAYTTPRQQVNLNG